MKICGACEKELPKESFSGKQWKIRKSLRRCKVCVAAGNELVLFTKGRERSEDDECPICSRLLPLDQGESTLYLCCMKTVCKGCALEADKRGIRGKCPFCRTPLPTSNEASLAMIQNRVKANDTEAIHCLGTCYRHGDHGLKKDMPRAVRLWERAAELGLKEAHFDLGNMFDENIAFDGVDNDMSRVDGVDNDMSRAIEHYEFAAKQGDVIARNNLGAINYNMGNYGLARKHWMISAKLGFKESLDEIKEMYMKGMALKSDYAEVMRGYYVANKEMSSPERDESKRRERLSKRSVRH